MGSTVSLFFKLLVLWFIGTTSVELPQCAQSAFPPRACGLAPRANGSLPYHRPECSPSCPPFEGSAISTVSRKMPACAVSSAGSFNDHLVACPARRV
jgi:hypothetical protein